MSKDWGLLNLKPTWQKAVLGVGLFLLLRKKDDTKPKAPGSPEGTEAPDEGVAGPLTIHIDHLDGADTVYERTGPPSIWGQGLTHEDIEGIDDDPVWVGEATGPVAPPSSGSFLTPTTIGLGLGVLLLGAAVMMPSEKRANPYRRKTARRRKKPRKRRTAAQRRKARKRVRQSRVGFRRKGRSGFSPDDYMGSEWRRVGMKRKPTYVPGVTSAWID